MELYLVVKYQGDGDHGRKGRTFPVRAIIYRTYKLRPPGEVKTVDTLTIHRRFTEYLTFPNVYDTSR